MAVDFFDRQDRARRQTTRLLVLFALSVVAIILVIYLIAVVVLSQAAVRHGGQPTAWNPMLLAWIALGTTVVITLGSLYKIAELSSGGETVALMLGGRLVNPQTSELAERKVLNVVEEMALASGVPVPPVFVLENEPGINAFAAGHQPGDAVVAVSRGCLDYLTREELQGVLAHEFSHILNGDMRLNLRLIGVVNGILVLAIIGYYVMRSSQFVSSGDSKKGDPGMAIFLLGLVLLILGYIGVFFGKLIKSAISRQREFLADASAVQFTRNPDGIAGALKKIGGLSEGSRIRDGHAEEVSHMFFGDAFAGQWFNLMATHPPLDERIRVLDPQFDGRFPEVQPLVETPESAATPPARRPGLMPPIPGIPPIAAMPLTAAALTGQVGRPQTEHLDHAVQTVAGLPPLLVEAARQPFSARAVICALLLSRDDDATRQRQWQILQAQVEPPLVDETRRLSAAVQCVAVEATLMLVDMTIPALKQASPQQYTQFRQVVEALVGADGKVDIFEYAVRTMLFSYLDVHFGVKKPPAVRYRTIDQVMGPATVVLSALAYAGQTGAEAVGKAFGAGAQRLPGPPTLLPPAECTFRTFDAALGELAQSHPKVKRDLISAVVVCINADQNVTLKENELLRAIAAALACPVPPIVSRQ